MTVRNVGIVFSPTLNIPAPVFALFLQQYDGIFGQEPEDHDFTAVQSVTMSAPLTPEDIRSPRQQKFQNLPTPSYDQTTFSQTQGFPQPQYYQPQQPQQRYDTGFTPLQPSYETQYQNVPTMAGPEYGSRASTIAGPAYEQFNGGTPAYRQYENQNGLTGKSKRRESSMFGLGLGQKKASNNKLREERLVDEESFFD